MSANAKNGRDLAGFYGAQRPLDTSNEFAVAARGERILVMCLAKRLPMVDLGPLELSRAQALVLSAWLAVLADPGGREFERVRRDIEGR
jgi:hypothetical protein